MKQRKASPRRATVLVVAFLVCALIFAVMVARRYQLSQKTPPVPAAQQASSSRLVELFFALPDASGLVREGREIDACNDQVECLQSILLELQNGPVGDYEAILPESAPLPTVTVNGDTAVVDLSAELVAELPQGTAAEIATVYGLVNTITINFPAIRQVQLVIGGKKAETLRGHIDISEPLTQDLSSELKNDVAPPAAAGGPGVK